MFCHLLIIIKHHAIKVFNRQHIFFQCVHKMISIERFDANIQSALHSLCKLFACADWISGEPRRHARIDEMKKHG